MRELEEQDQPRGSKLLTLPGGLYFMPVFYIEYFLSDNDVIAEKKENNEKVRRILNEQSYGYFY